MPRSPAYLNPAFRFAYGAIVVICALLLFTSQIAFAQQGEQPHIYEVKPGDTLVGIGEKFGVSIEALMQANGITDANVLYVGQKLTVPDKAVAAPAPADDDLLPLAATDNVFTVSDRLGVLPQDLLALNGGMPVPYFRLQPAIFAPQVKLGGWPQPVLAFRHSPQIVQGQTGMVELVLAQNVRPKGMFGENKLHFFRAGRRAGRYHFRAFLPTPALLEPGDYVLQVQVGEVKLTSKVPVVAGQYITQHIVLPPAKGALLAPELVQAELAKLHMVWDPFWRAKLWRQAFRFPIAPGFQRTSPYGTRRSYNDGPVNSFHTGTDWSAPEGTSIQAPAPGVVVLAETLQVRGGAVILDHGLGVTSSFWHMSRIDVAVGQRVERGEIIGLVGTTGLSTGAHLHWEVRVNGIAVNPMQWSEMTFPYLPLVDATPDTGD